MFRKIPIEKIEQFNIICKNGDIIDKITHQKLNYHINHDGYYAVYIKQLKSSFLVHRIIMSKYKPNEYDVKLLVNHKDLNKLNNNISNLEWVNNKENVMHYLENSNIKQHKKYNKLSKNDIIQCYQDLLNGMSTKYVVDKYKISKSTVLNIKYKRVYTDILSQFENIPVKISNTYITDDIILKIQKDIINNIKPCNIAQKYNIDVQIVKDFKSGKIFKQYYMSSKKFLGGEKLSEEDVVYILKHTDVDVSILSYKFNVTKQTIKNIWNRKTWKHINV